MPADIFASLQTLIQPQTPPTQTIHTQSQPEGETQPGLFASLMMGLTESEEDTLPEGQVLTVPELGTPTDTPAFTRSSVFAGAVLEVIAGTDSQETETLDSAPE